MARIRFHVAAKLALSAASVAIPVSVANAQETRSAPVISNPPLGAVILRSEPHDVTMKSLHVLRQLPIAKIRSLSQPIVKVGTTTLNFKPMLENPRALFNIAASLRKLPTAALVIAEETTASEIDQGMVVNSTLTYRLKPGACSDSPRRAMITKAGVSCATMLSDSALATAFANPKDAHYVANPGKRAAAIAEAKSNRAASGVQIAADIAELRASFKDPAKRGQIDANVGAAESTRLAGLSDEQLTMELVNSAETKVEQTIFIPGAETPNARLSTSKFAPRNGKETDPMSLQVVNPAALSGLGGGKPKSSAPPIQDTTRNLDTRIFLTGFTLGRHYEWREGVSTTISWCLVGCKKTYSATVYAKIGLGFGLRFPMQISGLYKHHLEKGNETATLTPSFEPIDGNAEDYAAAGLSKVQQFHGQEIVAEAVAEAGVNFELPIYGHTDLAKSVGDDYTSALPAPFTNGQFKPPAPGQLGFPSLEHKFPDQDLLLGVANWGAFGAKVFPQVKFDLKSTSLRFKFHDLQTNEPPTWIDYKDQSTPLALKIDADDHSSHFTLSDPEYKLAFTVTPGLVGELFIHLGVWSHDWDYGVWFPQVAVTLPPGGLKFACHEGTSCSRRYDFSPTSQSDSVGPASANTALFQQWKYAFIKKWKPQCPDQFCKDHIYGIPFLSITDIFGGHVLKLMDEEVEKIEEVQKITTSDNLADVLKLAQYYEGKIQQGWQDAENAAAEQVELAKIRMAKQGHSTPVVIFTAMPKFPAPTAPPPLMQGRTGLPTSAFPPPAAPTRSAPAPAPDPAPPPVTQGRTRIPNLVFPPAVTPRGAPAVMKSTLCSFNSGPRAGQVQDYAPMAPIPVGSNCQDARGSFGTVVAQ